ncbi:MAG TPA: flagellar hook basal-body protein [Rhizomicrobium sp.]|nr:flagellar hook basal-body protein [Rhizomicrobium sp.]
MGLVEIASTILSRAEQRVELCAQNLSNSTTPGYKARSSFSAMIAPSVNESNSAAMPTTAGTDFTNGALQTTGNPFDLAIAGSGFFAVRDAAGTYYTRDGQFSRNADGRLVTADGKALQAVSGDVVVGAGDMKVLADGTVLSDGEPSGRIALQSFDDLGGLEPAGGNLFVSKTGEGWPASAQVRQGMLEASNVSTAAEMISMMIALRGAGTGQHVVQVYDDLMGRAVNAFTPQQ